MVPALGGAPGVYSARYAGTQGDDAANNAKLLREMAALTGDDAGRVLRQHRRPRRPEGDGDGDGRGAVSWRHRDRARGTGGFGYDPLFLVPEYGQTFGELPPEVKQSMSHRARAFAQLRPAIEREVRLMSFSELHSDIAAFRHYLQSERGLSDNTVQAYGRDLDRFTKWCGLVRYHGVHRADAQRPRPLSRVPAR